MKLFIIFACILALLIKNTKQTTKCNERILKKFMLSGMKYSIYDKMETCGQVHDKCCSVADEIKITKLWKERTNNILSNHIDTSLYYLNRITHHFYELGKLDPRLMTLKYISRKEVPYQEEKCNFQIKDEDYFSKNQFIDHLDASLKKKISPPPNKFQKKKIINLKKHTHDQFNNRHWSVKIPSNQMHIFRLFKNQYNFKENITERQVTCKKETTSFTKDFVVVNQRKAEFCYNLYDKILNFDNIKFNTFLSNVKSGFKTIAKFKGSFYCSVCDAHQQRFFDIKNKKFIFDRKFCRKLIIRNEPMLKYLHVIFIEYADFLLQYMECFESNAKQFELPYPNFLNKYKLRIPLIRKCLKNINEDTWMNHCWFLCEQYDLFGISSFFEGDLILYKRIHLGLYSFLRKLDRLNHESKKIDFDTIGNINGLLVEPLNPSHTISKQYYLENKIRKKIMGVLDTRPKFTRAELKEATRFFTLAKDTMGVKTVEGLVGKLKTLKIKKKKKIMKKIDYMQSIISGKRKIKKKQLFGKKKKIFSKTGKLLRSPINGLTDWIIKAKLDKKHNHSGKRPRKLYNKKIYPPLNYDRESHKNYKEYIFSPKTLIENRTSKDLKLTYIKKMKIIERDEKNLKLKQKVLKKEKKNKKFKEKKKIVHSRIETSSEIYNKNFDELQMEKFEIEYKDEGMDPSYFIDLVDFDLDITGLIKKKFKLPEKVTNSVIHQYLSYYPKLVNTFNHEIDNMIMDGDHMQAVAHDYVEAKKNLENAGPRERAKYREIVRDVKKRHAMKMNYQKDMKFLKKIKMKRKYEALEKMQKEKVVMEDHVDEEHFDSNFTGIRDFFVNMFGT